MSGLQPGAEVRLETVEGRRIEGWVTAVDSTSIVVTDRRGERHDLPRDRLRQAWRRTSSTGLYARRGAIAGAVGFGGYLSLLAGGLCEAESCGSEFAEGLAVGAPLGALGGVVAGALLGSVVSRWQAVSGDPSGPVSAETGWRLHLGGSGGPAGDGPSPVALMRVAVDREIGSGRRGFLEVAHIVYREDRLMSTDGGAVRDAGTWSVGLGLTQPLGSAPDIRLNASAAMARSSSDIRFVGAPPPGVDEDSVQYGSQLAVGIEVGWSPAFAPGIDVGLEGRYDYVPLFFDGVQLFTLSLAVWG